MSTRKISRRVVLGTMAAAPLGIAWRTRQSATPNEELTNLFNAYSDSGVGWTGADSTYSVTLPDGRVVWIFSDTFLGPVNPDGSGPRTAPFINNSFVVQFGTALTTRHGGTAQEPASLVAPETGWYWAGAGILGAGTLDVTYLQFHRTGDGSFDFAWDRSVLVRFDVATLEPIDTTDLPSAVPDLHSAAWLTNDDGHPYIYRVEDLGADKYLHIARVTGVDLRGDWEFYTGRAWSTDEAASARILRGVSNEHSVTRVGDRWVLITQDTTEPLSARIVAYFADTPTGPFTDKTLIYTTPETGGNVFTYNPHAHPELSADGKLVVSYNVNSLVPDDLYADISIYRPRFLDVQLD